MSNLKFRYLIVLFFTLAEAHAQSWFSRQWHNSVSHYNYYFNASMLVADAREETLIGYKDRFKDVLSLYPISEPASLKGNAAKMDEVLKKCSHVIEKHGKCKWVDDSYLLMGDAQLFKGDFYSAIEVYEYVASTFKNTVPAYQAEINLVRTYILMNKMEDAEALYTRLAAKKDLPVKLKPQLDIAGAAVNIRQGKYAVAIKLLEAAIPKTRLKHEKVRYNFVLAQLYGLSKNNVKATLAYKKVIKLNPPYQFAFNAKLNMAKAINVKNRGEIRVAKQTLRDMLRDDKNKEFFDQIYFELGNLELADKNEPAAVREYQSCLRSGGSDQGIKSNAYLALADIYFKGQDYEFAQVYYDSAARTIDPLHPDYKKIQTKNLVLNELIKHLVNIREKDSLLRLADNEKLREKTIDKLIREAREKQELEKQQEELQKVRQQQMQNEGAGMIALNTNFPFYNMAARSKGLQDFQRIWGARELMDFWAISSNKSKLWEKIDAEQKSNDMGSELRRAAMEKAPDERKQYYENIPFTKAEKEDMKNSMSESYFLGANVYYQDLREYDKARKMLEELLNRFPGSSYQMNAWYLLARISMEQKNSEKAEYYTGLIRQADPASKFLNVLSQNPDDSSSMLVTEKADDVVERLYDSAYRAFRIKKYEIALKMKAENDLRYPGNPLQVNFDYLEALILGEKGEFKSFQTKLQAIADNYPGTAIAGQALRTIELLKIRSGEKTAPAAGAGKYSYRAESDHFYMLIVPRNTDMTALKLAFLNYNKSFFASDGLKVTTSILGDQYQILIVNQFKTLEAAGKYISQLRGNAAFFSENKISDPVLQYLISKENFSLLITDKILDDYTAFYKAHYTF